MEVTAHRPRSEGPTAMQGGRAGPVTSPVAERFLKNGLRYSSTTTPGSKRAENVPARRESPLCVRFPGRTCHSGPLPASPQPRSGWVLRTRRPLPRAASGAAPARPPQGRAQPAAQREQAAPAPLPPAAWGLRPAPLRGSTFPPRLPR